jgi:hypothetical protein
VTARAAHNLNIAKRPWHISTHVNPLLACLQVELFSLPQRMRQGPRLAGASGFRGRQHNLPYLHAWQEG